MKRNSKLRVGHLATYHPAGVISRYDGKQVLVTAHNRHGHATIKFLDGPRQGQDRGVKETELSQVEGAVAPTATAPGRGS